MRRKVKYIAIIISSVVLIALLTLWFTGVFGLWTDGIAYLANNTKVFTDTRGYIIPGEYSVDINIGDLQSNIGKELYNDGNNRIFVSQIDNTGDPDSGGYIIEFMSAGQYSLTKATLVSGIHHATNPDNSFTSFMSAKMTAKYNDKVYACEEAGTSGLISKDGDAFGFYIFPYESYKNGDISLNMQGTINLHVSNLYNNIWTKRN